MPLSSCGRVLLSGLILSALSVSARAGDQFKVSSDSRRQRFPVVVADSVGAFAISWIDLDSGNVVTQRYRRNGTPLEGELRLADVTEARFRLSGDRDDQGYVLVWGRDSGTEGQLFDAGGNRLGSFFEVSEIGYEPAVTRIAEGGFVVSWWEYYFPFKARRFDATGSPLGPVFEIPDSAGPSSVGPAPSIGSDSSGRFTVAWSRGLAGGGDAVYFRRFDPSGSPLGATVRVDAENEAGRDADPVVAVRPDGALVIVWASWGDADYDIRVRSYDASGAPRGSQLEANQYTTGRQFDPAVAFTPDGGFAVAWVSRDQDGSGAGVFLRRFDRVGRALGGELPVNQRAEGDQDEPALAALPNGDLLVAWRSDAPGAALSGIFARRISATDVSRDSDGDGVPDGADNCPTVANPEQTDVDANGWGDDCVSPDAVIADSADLGLDPRIGRGTVISSGVSIGDRARIGEYVRIERQASAGDDLTVADLVFVGRRTALGDGVALGASTRIEGFVEVADGVAVGDDVQIKRNVVLGSYATIEPLAVLFARARIGAGAIVGMGARVGKDAVVLPGAVVPSGTTVPAGTTFP